MSFLTAAPEFVTAAAGDLADIGSMVGAANAAAALSTTGVAAAAADEVSTQIAMMFGAYAQRYQALSAQAAAFHNEFVSLMNGSALAYVTTEVANAEQNLLTTVMPTAVSSTAAALPILGGSGGLLGGLLGGATAAPLLGGLGGLLGGGSGGLLGGLTGGLSSFSGLFGGFGSFLGGLPTLSDLIGPINLGNLTPGLSLTAGPLGPILNGIGLDLGNFLSNELVNGITLSNLASLATGLFQDVPPLQGLLPVLQSLLPGLFGQPVSPVVNAAYPNPYQVLVDTTIFNLNLMGSTFLSHPFPILNQIASNQSLYLHELSNGVAVDLQNFPANVPANIELAIQGASTFNPAALGQTFVNGTSGFYGTVGTSLQHFGSDIQTTLPVFENDMGMANTAISTGDYHGAVQDEAHALLGLFITGFDTSHVGISGSITSLLPPDFAITIAGPVGLLGPAGDLLPILTAAGQEVQGLPSLVPPSIPAQMVGNFANAIGAITDTGVSADFAVNVGLTGGTLAGTAIFGLPLQLGFAILGPPFATLDGLATGATAFSTAMQTGNVLGALNAIADTPAYMLNGMLNGQVIVDLPLPVTVSTPLLGSVTLPAIAHVPFDGLLVPPQPLTVTIPLDVLGIDIPINATLGGTEFGGLLPFLVNTMPEQIALAIAAT